MDPWFRFYHETLDDPKVQKLPAPLFKAWVNLLCLAARHNGVLPPLEDIGFALRTNPEKADKIVVNLIDAKLFDATPDGVKPHNWNKRQFKSDVSTKRVKRFRERFRNGERNAPDTEQIQSRTEQSIAEPPISVVDVSRETFLRTCWVMTDCDRSARPFSEMVFGQWWAEGVRVEDLSVIAPILARQRIGDPKAIMPPGYYTNAVRDAMRKRMAGVLAGDALRSEIDAAWEKIGAA